MKTKLFDPLLRSVGEMDEIVHGMRAMTSRDLGEKLLRSVVLRELAR